MINTGMNDYNKNKIHEKQQQTTTNYTTFTHEIHTHTYIRVGVAYVRFIRKKMFFLNRWRLPVDLA